MKKIMQKTKSKHVSEYVAKIIDKLKNASLEKLLRDDFKKIISSILIVLMIHQDLSASILLPSIEISPAEFQAKVKTSSDKYEGFSDNYLKTHPLEQNTKELLDLFEKAQMFYFSQSFDQAKEVYTKILFMTEIDDWRELQRKIFFTTFLRLAEVDSANEEDYLNRAVLFAPEINVADIEAKPDLKDKAKKLRKNLKQLEWNVTGFQKDFRYIVMNGHIIDLKKTNKVILPQGKFRITFLSDYYKPQTMNVSAQQVPLMEPVKTSFVNGTCQNPKVLNDGGIKDYEVYFGKECAAEKEKTVTANELSPAYANLPTQSSFLEVPEKPIYKKTWFWVTVGAVAAGTIYYIVQKNKREDSPSEEPSREEIE